MADIYLWKIPSGSGSGGYASYPHNCYIKAETSTVMACFQINANSYFSAEAITDIGSLINAFQNMAVPASGLLFDANKNLIGAVTGAYVGSSDAECVIYYIQNETPSEIGAFPFSDITTSVFEDVVPGVE